MYFRVKQTGAYSYLQIVRSQRGEGRVQQQVLTTLGRLDVLRESGQLDRLMRSGLRHCEKIRVLDAHAAGETEPVSIRSIGPDLVFGRLWAEAGLPDILKELLGARRFGFDVERAVYLTVLHRLFASGSDRAAERWREDYRIPGVGDLDLHHLYRAMAWLGEPSVDEENILPARAVPRTGSRRPCSTGTVTFSAGWTWCSSIPHRSTSRGKAGQPWASAGTARTGDPTSSR